MFSIVNKMSPRYHAPAVRKAFAILDFLAKADHPLRISELSKGLSLGKSTVHGLVRTLHELGIVEMDRSSGGYFLGYGLMRLIRSTFVRLQLPTVARPFMEQVMELTGESVFLGIRREDRVIILDIVESRNDLRVTSPRGATLPLFAAATGKVFLAGMDRESAASIVRQGPLPKFTDKSITDPEEFLAQVERARKEGYATDDQEYLPGVRAVAAPIIWQGSTIAALWVVGFTSSLTEDKMERVIQSLKRATRGISSLLQG